MAIVEIGDPGHIRALHFLGPFDVQRFPTQSSQELAVRRVLQAVQSIYGEFVDAELFEGKAKLGLVKGGASYTISIVLRDDKVAVAREIGQELHHRLQELWPPGLS